MKFVKTTKSILNNIDKQVLHVSFIIYDLYLKIQIFRVEKIFLFNSDFN